MKKQYRLLGRTGLRVSPLALGTMTFGTETGWGADKSAARQIFQAYLDLGGNFFDTADMYTNGRSEEFLGEFVQDAKARDQVVIATKFSFSHDQKNPNGGGNGRKNIRRALEGSLKRLKTDYIDLYWMHAWDRITPVEEVVTTFNDLVREGKILHFGLSDVPAWYASRAQTIALERKYEPVAALQLEYSLVARHLEREHLPLARSLGMSLIPWSPLAGGFLTGKYKKTSDGVSGDGRIKATLNSGNPVFEKFTAERSWRILFVLEAVAKELNQPPAMVALNWVVNRHGVTSTLIGATRIDQLKSNLDVLNFEIPEPLLNRLNEVSAFEPNELDHFFQPGIQTALNGEAPVTPFI